MVAVNWCIIASREISILLGNKIKSHRHPDPMCKSTSLIPNFAALNSQKWTSLAQEEASIILQLAF